jgi:hypothetical protein
VVLPGRNVQPVILVGNNCDRLSYLHACVSTEFVVAIAAPTPEFSIIADPTRMTVAGIHGAPSTVAHGQRK